MTKFSSSSWGGTSGGGLYKYGSYNSDKELLWDDYKDLYDSDPSKYVTAGDYWEDDEVKYKDILCIVTKVHRLTNELTIKDKHNYTSGIAPEIIVKASEVKMHKLANNSLSGSGKNLYNYKQCSHKMAEYKFPKTNNLSVYMSSHRAGKLESDLQPTDGVYLDSIWNDELFTFNDSAVERNPYIDTNPNGGGFNMRLKLLLRLQSTHSKVFVDWPDQRVIPIADYQLLVEYCWKTINTGILEIGCIGGHGRTGTLLGGMILYHSYLTKEPMDSKTAIATVRDKYCKQAIESKVQENLLEEYAVLLGDKHE